MIQECLIDKETEEQEDYISACINYLICYNISSLRERGGILAPNLGVHHHGVGSHGERVRVAPHSALASGEKNSESCFLTHLLHFIQTRTPARGVVPHTLRVDLLRAVRSSKFFTDILRGDSRSCLVNSEY